MRSLVLATALFFQSIPAFACSIDAQAMVFGNVDVTRDTTATGLITVDCDLATVFGVSIRSASDGADRIMSGPNGAELRYRLYVDPGFIQEWGDGGATGATVGGNVAAGSSTEYTVYGLIPEQSLVPAGSYTDLPIVILLF